MGKIISAFLAVLGTCAAQIGSQACAILWIDEPEAPDSLVK